MFSLIPLGLKLVFITVAIIGALGTLGYCQKQKINRLNKEVKKNSIILENKQHKTEKRIEIFTRKRKEELKNIKRLKDKPPVKKPTNQELENFRNKSFESFKALT